MVFRNAGPSRPDSASRPEDTPDATAARDSLLQKISSETNLPSLGSSISRVVQMASSDDEAVRDLAHFILSDVALTQKILRIANTVSYRTASGTPVTTVSKALFLLGFETVKTSALAMLLVEGMSGKHAKSVRNELGQALCASIVGRELARRSQYRDGEEAAIAALFKNIGRVLVAAHDFERYSEINKLIESGTHTGAQASMEVLGCSFDALAETVLREWNIPDTIVQALVPAPAGILKPARSRQEWLQQVATFSTAAARLIPGVGEVDQDAASKAVLTRFGAALSLDQAKLAALLASVAQETRLLVNNTDATLAPEDAVAAPGPAVAVHKGEELVVEEALESGLPAELLMDIAEPSQGLAPVQRHASGKPMNARELLLAGVQDVTQMTASGRCRVNDLMLLVLETLYGSMGFRFVTVCLKDLANRQFRARISVGDNSKERQAGFLFPDTSQRDLFDLAMENDADLMISDATSPKIRGLLPAWHRALLPDARSFIVLPLVVQKKKLGLFYADRTQPAPEGVPPDEAALIRTLKGQILTALQQR